MHKWLKELSFPFSHFHPPYDRLTLCVLDSSVVHLHLLYVRCSPVGRHVFAHYCTTFGTAMGVFCLLLHSNIVPQTYIPQSAHSLLLSRAHIFPSIDIMCITNFNNLYAVSQISFSFYILVLLCSSFALFCISSSVCCIVSPMQVVQHNLPPIPAT